MCIKCWRKISDFHNFYAHIESVHNAIHTSKQASEDTYDHLKFYEHSPKEEDSLNDDHWSYHSEPEDSKHEIIGIIQINRISLFVLFLKVLHLMNYTFSI